MKIPVKSLVSNYGNRCTLNYLYLTSFSSHGDSTGCMFSLKNFNN